MGSPEEIKYSTAGTGVLSPIKSVNYPEPARLVHPAGMRQGFTRDGVDGGYVKQNPILDLEHLF
jgi:hypothetical protein